MNRTATWTSIGTNVENKNTLNEVLKASGLDYTVGTREIKTADGIIIPNSVATVRENDGSPIGIVSKSYKVCQNEEAFDFVNYIDNVSFVRAGETSNGMVYIIGELPECNVLGDAFKPYVIFQNSHNGRYTIKAAIAPLRIVCQNQFTMAFKESENTINIKHSSKMNIKMEQARDVLAQTEKFMETLNSRAQMLASVKVTPAQVTKLIEDMFPIKEDMTEHQKEVISMKRAEFLNAYDCEDNQNFKGNAWGLVNSYSDYITHTAPQRKTANWEESKFMAVTLTPDFAKFIKMLNTVGVAA